jgi:hypothetical protein
MSDAGKLLDQHIETQRAEWRDQISKDPEMGGKLEQMKIDIGRMYDRMGNSDAVAKMKAALDFTGAGDHPDIVRGVWLLAQKTAEGTHVSGQGASALGQTSSGQASRPSPAQSMYPNLS